MANALYTPAKHALGTGALVLNSGTFKVALVDAGAYALAAATHEFLASVPVGARIATATLTGVTWLDGVFDAADASFGAVTGVSCEALILYKFGTGDADSRLIAYLDTGYTNLPVTPGGTTISLVWPNGADKIFRL